MGTEFYHRVERIDRLLEIGPSERAVGSEIMSLIQDRDIRQYFFERGESPGWLDVLPDSVFLKTRSRGGWLGARYLEKVAGERPEDVVRICGQVLESQGRAELGNVLRILREVPASQASIVVSEVERQLRSGNIATVGRHAAGFAESLLEGERSEEGLSILSVLIELDEPENEAAFGRKRLPQPKVRGWDYEKIVSDQLELAFEVDPLEAWLIALKAFEEAMESDGGEEGPSSGYWRAAIEDHAQNEPTNHLDELLDFVRDKAVALIDRNMRSASAVIERIRDSEGVIFKRLELYLCQESKSETCDFIRENLLTRELFGSARYHHEYFHLLRCCFDVLDDEERAEVMGWIDDELTFAEGEERLKEWFGREVEEDEVERFIAGRRLKRLSAIEPHLNGQRLQEYNTLVEKLGEPEHADFLTYHYPVRHGPESPVDRKELEDATVDEIVADLPRLLEEQASEEPSLVMPTEGVSRQLASVISGRPNEFSAVAPQFMRGGALAVQAMLSGLRTALDDEDGEDVNWEPVWELCDLALSEEFSYETNDRSSTRSAWDWAIARRRVADLIAKALGQNERGPGIEFQRDVWELLGELVTDPDPDPSAKRTSDLDPATESINTTRGQAMHGVFRYCLWVARSWDNGGGADNEFNLHRAEEAREVLEHHLDPSNDASLAIRSVYGQWLPSIAAVDTIWTDRTVGEVFPASLEDEDYWAAAWVTYLTFWTAVPRVYELLRSEYRRAVGRLERLSSDDDYDYALRDPAERLGEHLIVLYWLGALEANDDESLLRRLFAEADRELRVHVIEFVGRSLGSTDREDIGSGVLERLRSFWNWRLQEAEGGGDARFDLHGFVTWFSSGVFEAEWVLGQLYNTLKLGKSVPQYPKGAIEYLGELAATAPRFALDCLVILASEDFGTATIRTSIEATKSILRQALQSGDQDVRRRAEDFVDGLGREGFVDEFRELMSHAGSPNAEEPGG